MLREAPAKIARCILLQLDPPCDFRQGFQSALPSLQRPNRRACCLTSCKSGASHRCPTKRHSVARPCHTQLHLADVEFRSTACRAVRTGVDACGGWRRRWSSHFRYAGPSSARHLAGVVRILLSKFSWLFQRHDPDRLVSARGHPYTSGSSGSDSFHLRVGLLGESVESLLATREVARFADQKQVYPNHAAVCAASVRQVELED